MTQLGWWPGSKSASKHSFASPSIMTFIHPSATASLTAQSTAATSAWAGGHLQYGLIHVLMGVPEWSLATTASAVKVLLTAASTLSFMFYTMFRHYASRVLALCGTVAAIVLWFFFFLSVVGLFFVFFLLNIDVSWYLYWYTDTTNFTIFSQLLFLQVEIK